MILDLATYLPETRLINEQLVADLARWTPEEVFTKTGIRARAIAGPAETGLDMGEAAARRLLERRTDAAEIDFILFCTQFPDYNLPPNATLLQARLGLPSSLGATDFSLACSGYVYGLFLADALLRSGNARKILLVTGDTYTRHIAPSDSVSRPIFGDAASATLLGAESPVQVHAFTLGTDGSEAMRLATPNLGERARVTRGSSEDQDSSATTESDIRMQGPDIFNFTLRTVPSSIRATLDKAGLTPADVDYFVLHQANAFMLEHLRRRIGASKEQFVVDLANTGNTVASSIPLVLDSLRRDGRLDSERKILLSGFGVGFSWGSCILDWRPPHDWNSQST